MLPPVVSSAAVAVIDIGSNSIKVLVAQRAADGTLAALKYRTIDARISAGISQEQPRLSEEGMARGAAAIRDLLADAAAFAPAKTILVATSAVRDARNGDEFRARVRAATGHEIRILSGDEEANLIGRGLVCDPALVALRDFYVFDLGGGSLECLAFRDRQIRQVASLPLGCVRLTEKFPADKNGIVANGTRAAIAQHTREVLARSAFAFSLPKDSAAVGTGGTLTTVRTILAARDGKPLEQTSATLTVAELREMLAWLGDLPLAERKQVPGLPPARADIFPTALATAIALAEAGGFSAYQNSLYNLRYGVAAAVLGGESKRTGRAGEVLDFD
jgi:exopolyphosphatase/guanosine-5'-triphosphate,3'-diphosphate pyrophosphatase